MWEVVPWTKEILPVRGKCGACFYDMFYRFLDVCWVSARAMIWGVGCALSKACRSTIVVCISLVLMVVVVMSGCMYGCDGVRLV